MRFLERPGAGVALGSAFATYALLLTGHPAIIVVSAWQVGLFALLRVAWTRTDRRLLARRVALFGVSVAAGVLAAAPVLWDLLEQLRRSVVGHAPPELALSWYRAAYTPVETAFRLAHWFDPFWFGVPAVTGAYPIPETGIGPLVVTLGFMSLAIGRWKHTLAWQLSAGAGGLVALSPDLFLFAARYLGLHVAPFPPEAGVVLPVAILAAYTVDAAPTLTRRRRALLAVMAVLPLLTAFMIRAGVPVQAFDGRYVLLSVVVVGCVVAYVVRLGPTPVVAAAVLVLALHSRALLPVQAADDIDRSSTLIDLVREYTDGGFRYAVVGPKDRLWLPPNHEAWHGLRSIQSYDALASRNYQRFTTRISDQGAFGYGRWFPDLTSTSRLDDDRFSHTGVNLLVSRRPLDAGDAWRSVAVSRGIHLYRAIRDPVLQVQIEEPTWVADVGAVVRGRLESVPRLPVRRLAADDDTREFAVTAVPHDTLLFLSMQHHPHWRARSDATDLEIVLVNDFYLGVRIPPMTTALTIAYEPLVLWSWVPQVGFVVAGLVLLIAAGRARHRTAAGRSGAAIANTGRDSATARRRDPQTRGGMRFRLVSGFLCLWAMLAPLTPPVSAQTNTAEASQFAPLRWLLGGRWEASTETQNGELGLSMQFRLGPPRQTINWALVATNDRGSLPLNQGLMYWHPRKESLAIVIVNREGEVTESSGVVTSEALEIEGVQLTRDGSATPVRVVLARTGEREFVQTSFTREGDAWAEQSALTFRRTEDSASSQPDR